LQDAATPQALADALWLQMDNPVLKTALRQRFTDMHHSLLRDTANESAQAVCQVLARRPKR
jgi:lipid-A-disaccharide synthase